MHPTRGFGAQPLAQQVDHADHWVAAGLRTVSQGRQVVLAQQPADLGLRLRRSDLVFDQRLLPRILDRFHRRQQSRIGHQGTRSGVPGPEQAPVPGPVRASHFSVPRVAQEDCLPLPLEDDVEPEPVFIGLRDERDSFRLGQRGQQRVGVQHGGVLR